MTIAGYEARYCYFDYAGYSLNYPRYKVTAHEMSEPTTIYMINDTDTGKYLMTAVRGCAIPPGV